MSREDHRERVVKSATKRNAVEYNMTHKYRGKALIFSHETFINLPRRTGANVDSNCLKYTLEHLHFEVITYENYCANDIKRVISETASEDHSNSDCILIAILSHGSSLGLVAAFDRPYEIDSLCNLLTPDNCRTLTGKPKLFIVQACEGEKVDHGIDIKTETQTDGHSEMAFSIPIQADFLIAFSTCSGYYSWRNPKNGSWFIQSLCVELNENGKQDDILTLLTFVAQRVGVLYESNSDVQEKNNKKQIPCTITKLMRILRFRDKPSLAGK